jgi:NADPH2:quinone reductase
MRAVVCRELGPPSSLVVEEQPDPEPGPGQVVVRMEAAGVNFVDALFIAGQYQIKPPLPFVPGSEIAGVITKMGEGVHDRELGEQVMASVGLGGFATHVLAPASAALTVPNRLSAEQAATFQQSYCTALFALRARGSLGPGETVLVLGAGGGVGLATIDVARFLGARVIAAASSADKRAAALGAGADAVIDSANEDVKERARALTGGAGVDVVVDPIGGALAEPALRALGDLGRYLVIGFASGTIPSIPLNRVLLRNRSVIGVDWGAWAMTHAEAQRQLLSELLGLAARGAIVPVEPVTHPLDDVAAALDDLTERRVVGKLALVP